MNDLRTALSKCVETAYLRKGGRLLALAAPSRSIRRAAEEILADLPNAAAPSARAIAKKEILEIEPYQGANPFILELMNLLADQGLDLAGAYVHGSLGSGEEIAYSDFDALAILGRSAFASAERLSRVLEVLYKARAIFFRFDPLQHHGWFLLTEYDLDNYPETYFPRLLFSYAKSLFPDRGLSLEIRHDEGGIDFTLPFYAMSDGIRRRLTSGFRPKNIYELKRLLSQFMLLPSLYYQAKQHKAIYKKFSFPVVRTDFRDEEWAVMDEVSAIRANWIAPPPGLWRSTASKPSIVGRFIALRKAPPIPLSLARRLDAGFFARMSALNAAMNEKLGTGPRPGKPL